METLRENLSSREEQSAEPQRGEEGQGQKIVTGFDKVEVGDLDQSCCVLWGD